MKLYAFCKILKRIFVWIICHRCLTIRIAEVSGTTEIKKKNF